MIDRNYFRDSVVANVNGEIKVVVRVGSNNSYKYKELLDPRKEYVLSECDIFNKITDYADYNEMLGILSLKISDEAILSIINKAIKEAKSVKKLIK